MIPGIVADLMAYLVSGVEFVCGSLVTVGFASSPVCVALLIDMIVAILTNTLSTMPPPVSFARSGIAAAWDPKFGNLLELAEACDVPVRWPCRIGVCHTCMTGLIAGSITYNPEPLERPAPGNVLVCCSQPYAGVTLDL